MPLFAVHQTVDTKTELSMTACFWQVFTQRRAFDPQLMEIA